MQKSTLIDSSHIKRGTSDFVPKVLRFRGVAYASKLNFYLINFQSVCIIIFKIEFGINLWDIMVFNNDGKYEFLKFFTLCTKDFNFRGQ